MTMPVNEDGPVNEHGGDLTAVRAQFPQVRVPWIDLSTGINPRAYPVPVLPDAAWRELPDASAFQRLRQAAASAYGAPATLILPASGTQALIQWLPYLRARLHGPSRVRIVSPTYSEHRSAWTRAGHTVRECAEPEADCDVLVITNPNNPDGNITSVYALAQIAESLRERNGWLVIDEAYCDTRPELSFCPKIQAHPNVIILRSFGKFFGLAGLRLGFAIAHPPLLGPLAEQLGPWAASGPAIAIAAQGLRDHAWIQSTRQCLVIQAEARDALLTRHGITLRGSHPLFCLVDSPHAPALFTQMALQGLYARRFLEHPHWLRIGAPSEEAFARMAGALTGLRAHAA